MVITDQIHGLRRYNTLVILVICITMFGLGLLLCTDVRHGRMVLDDSLDYYSRLESIGSPFSINLLVHCQHLSSVSWNVLLLLTFMVSSTERERFHWPWIAFSGGNNFRADVKIMLGAKNWGFRLYRVFQLCWMLITPLLILVRSTRTAFLLMLKIFLGSDYFHIYQLSSTSIGKIQISSLGK